jgi:metal-responsive CopG/Arc/MetJ family transcriptional regulator
MLEELDKASKKLNISRQTLIKRFIRRGLDQQYLDQKKRKVVISRLSFTQAKPEIPIGQPLQSVVLLT